MFKFWSHLINKSKRSRLAGLRAELNGLTIYNTSAYTYPTIIANLMKQIAELEEELKGE